MNSTISPNSIKYLKQLKKNNDRDWFAKNKPEYQTHLIEVEHFANALLNEMNKHDNIETVNGKKSLFRIYRDVRFSKNKAPYKTQWSGHFKRATAALRGGYYFHIEPGNCFVGGGFWGPSPEDMARIRQEIAADDAPLRKIINSKAFKSTFGELFGDQVKSAPRGYAKDHPAIDLLKYTQMILWKKFTDDEALKDDFFKEVNKTFKAMRPFLDYMSVVLTTDANGVSVLK